MYEKEKFKFSMKGRRGDTSFGIFHPPIIYTTDQFYLKRRCILPNFNHFAGTVIKSPNYSLSFYMVFLPEFAFQVSNHSYYSLLSKIYKHLKI